MRPKPGREPAGFSTKLKLENYSWQPAKLWLIQELTSPYGFTWHRATGESCWLAMTEHLWDLTANDLARKVADKEVSSLEVVEAHLDRIEEVNGWLNAVTRVLAEEAKVAAKDADKAVAAGDELGPLHGLSLIHI